MSGRRQKKRPFLFPPTARRKTKFALLLMVRLDGRSGEIKMLWPCLIALSDHFLKSPRQARNTTKTEESASGGNKKQHFFEIGKRHLSMTACQPSPPLRGSGVRHSLSGHSAKRNLGEIILSFSLCRPLETDEHQAHKRCSG